MLRDNQSVEPINGFVVTEMYHKFTMDSLAPWTHCHYAPTYFVLLQKYRLEQKGLAKIRKAPWHRAKA